jgi:hypothetical protein
MSVLSSLGSSVLGAVQQAITDASSPSTGPATTIGLTSLGQPQIKAVNPLATSSAELNCLSPGATSNYQIYRYPQELLGNSVENPPHAVMFYIDVPVASGYAPTSSAIGGAPIAVQQNAQAIASMAGDTLTNVLQPKLSRIQTAIALYMPDTIVAGYSHNWDPISLTEALGDLGKSAITIAGVAKIFSQIKGYTAEQLGAKFKTAPINTLTNVQLEALGLGIDRITQSGNAENIALNRISQAINPQVEMIYKGTDNRNFLFEFKFQPRNAVEAFNIQKIIQTFKMFAAPELIENQQGGSAWGRYFITPAQFDIQFMFSNNVNINLPTISTCVLQDIKVNYSQAGQFATFNDGMPIEIGLELRFKEVDIMYRQLIQKYGY